MKKILLTFIAALALLPASRADEGMWLLPLLEKINSETMRNLGSRLTPEQIYSVNHSSIKDAVVQFGGGCTGEIISGSGLLVTNHHCGYSSIQALSSEEHNYLEDGFWAMSPEEEIPVPGLTVKFLQSMTDVTGKARNEKAREALIVKADAETVVKPAHVQIGLVLHTSLLGRGAERCSQQECEQDKNPKIRQLHDKHITPMSLKYCIPAAKSCAAGVLPSAGRAAAARKLYMFNAV